MKNSIASFSNMGVAAVALVLASLPAPVCAGPFSFPGVVTTAGAYWYVSDNVVAINAPAGGPNPGGFGLTEAEFVDPNAGLDAYDGALVMRVNGAPVSAPPGVTLTTDAPGNTILTTGTTNVGVNGLFSSVQFTFFKNMPLVRTLYTFQNTGVAPVAATLRWEINLGSDSTTTTGNSPTDRWIVTSDSSTSPGDLVNTFARFGPDNGSRTPVKPTAASFPGGGSPRDLLADQYSVNIANGATVRLMMFAELNPSSNGVSAAETAAGDLFSADYAEMATKGLFDSLPGTSDQIINWVVPEPSTEALLIFGLGVLACRRSRRSRLSFFNK